MVWMNPNHWNNFIAKVLTRDIIRKDELSVATKVAIQVAIKIGAEPWRIDSFIQNVWDIF